MTRIPKTVEVMLPLMRLASTRDNLSCKISTRLLAPQFGIEVSDNSPIRASEDLKRFRIRVSWAIYFLKLDGLLRLIRRGSFQITDKGRELLKNPPEKMTIDQHPGGLERKQRKKSWKELYSTAAPVMPGIWYEVKTTPDGESSFTHCPQPLLPLENRPGAFLESILVVRDCVNEKPGISAGELYRKISEWAGHPHPGGMQVAFDALTMAGVLPRAEWDAQPERIMEWLLPSDYGLAELRYCCLNKLCARIKNMPALLEALTRLPHPDLNSLNDYLQRRHTPMPDLQLRLKLLTDLDALHEESNYWKITSLGKLIIIGATISDDFDISSHTTRHTSNNEENLLTSIYDLSAFEEKLISINDSTNTNFPQEKIGVYQKLQIRMHSTIKHVVDILFPINNKDLIIQKHSWWDKQEVGEVNGTPNIWRGWSLIIEDGNSRNSNIYIDLFENNMNHLENIDLFGEIFSINLKQNDLYVIAYVTGFKHEHIPIIQEVGFIPRSVGKKSYHACILVDSKEFIKNTNYHWAANMIKLINFRSQYLLKTEV
jgi:hypothetical protein